MSLVCIDSTTSLTCSEIKNRALGASEYQFYSLLNKLKETKQIKCFNHHHNPIHVDSIYYDSLSRFTCKEEDIILIQRFYPLKNIQEKMKPNKKILWIHDVPNYNIFLNGDKTEITYYMNNKDLFKDYLLSIINDSSVHFIANSKHTYDLFMKFIGNFGIEHYERCSIIYNMLYKDEFDTTPVVKMPKQLIYASAWLKGIEKVIDVFRYILSKDDEYTLCLMSPGWDWDDCQDYKKKIQEEFGDKIIIKGPSTKRDLSFFIKESCCCLSARSNETFGCVFAEAYYLGTPVIADKLSGAVREIIGDENIVDYDNKETVWAKLCSLEEVSLDTKFLANMDLWLDWFK